MLMPLAGFVPGYLIVICINRLVTLTASNTASKAALPVVYLLAAAILMYLCRRLLKRPRYWVILGGMATWAILFAGFLVLQVQLDNSGHVIGDGIERFFPLLINGQGMAASDHFPLFLQHYDEVMFLFPFLDASDGNARFMELFWLLYAYGRASAFAAVMLAVLYFSRSSWLALLVAAYLFFGSIHVYHGSYHLLFDSGNPLRQTLHIGRVILAVLPVVVLGLACSRAVKFETESKWALAWLAVMGIGAAALSSSLLIVVLSICIALFLLKLPLNTEGVVLSMLTLLASIIIAYAQMSSHLAAWFFLGGLVFSTAFLVLPSWKHVADGIRNLRAHAAILGIVSILAGMAIGLTLLGNSTARFGLEALGIDQIRTVIVAPHPIPPFSIGNNPFCGTFASGHCTDLNTFLERFGLLLMLPLVSVWVLSRRPNGFMPNAAPGALPQPEPGSSPKSSSRLFTAMVVLCLFFLVASFFAYDFTNGGMDTHPDNAMRWLPVWLKSRLIEPWAYAILAFSVSILWLASAGAGRVLLQLFLIWQIIAYCFLAKPPIHLVFMRNVSYLVDVVR